MAEKPHFAVPVRVEQSFKPGESAQGNDLLISSRVFLLMTARIFRG